ncbi:MAG: nucleotidyl transferase AbiEii/AbiGii toxin family protein [Candidatus ainarchaeum sp.]|nr:nucleotidyl transferase AbiEii/AbiGii toxin family protein [Candidatus ainarchaeum sp.]
MIGGIKLMDIKLIRKICLDTGLSTNYIIKDKEISKIFKLLENKFDNIILKGGTSLNRVYFNKFKRFSEDIDFDIFSKKEINILKEDIYLILKKYLKSYIVNKPRIMNKTIRFDIQYINEINQKDKIMLEFRLNNKDMPDINKKIIYPGFVDFDISYFNVYSLEELFYQKIKAFINRDEGKDIYDIYVILKDNNFPIKDKSIVINKLNNIINDDYKIKLYNNSTNHYILKK